VSHDILVYLKASAKERYVDLEEELHVEYPIKAVGVIATRDKLARIEASIGGFLQAEEDLAPEVVTDHFNEFLLARRRVVS
jgi:hypothetical protein